MIENYYTSFVLINLILLLIMPKVVFDWYKDTNKYKNKYFVYFSILLFTIACGLYLKFARTMPYALCNYPNMIVGCIFVIPFFPWSIRFLKKENSIYNSIYYIYFYILIFMVFLAYLI